MRAAARTIRVAPVLAAAGIVAVGVAAWPFTVDDAFIVARFAERVARGATWAMNDGPATDGVTGPLAVLPGVVARWLGLDAVAAAKGVGLAATALAAALVVRAAGRRSGGAIGAWLAAAVVTLGPTLGVWGAAGLETGLATLAFTVAALGTVHRPRPQLAVVGVAVAVLAWLRPELAVASAVLLAGLAVRMRGRVIVAVVLAIAGAVSVVVFRLVLFGHPLPLAIAAKPPELAEGLTYVLRGALVTTSGIGLLLAGAAGWRGRRGDGVLVWAVVAHLVAMVVVGGDWMPGFRLFAPVLPVIAILAAATAVRVLRRRRALVRWAAIGAVALACAIPVLDLVAQLPAVREAGVAREVGGRALAGTLGAQSRRVALVDVGYLAWASGVEVVDLGGLTDPVIARSRGGHLSKEIDPEYLAFRAPDTIVLHAAARPEVGEDGRLRTLAGYPVERRVASMRWVREWFRVDRVVAYAPSYYYVVLRDRGGGDDAGGGRGDADGGRAGGGGGASAQSPSVR